MVLISKDFRIELVARIFIGNVLYFYIYRYLDDKFKCLRASTLDGVLLKYNINFNRNNLKRYSCVPYNTSSLCIKSGDFDNIALGFIGKDNKEIRDMLNTNILIYSKQDEIAYYEELTSKLDVDII